MTSDNKSWICFGFSLALILGIISTLLVSLLFPIDTKVSIQYTASEVRNLHQFPIPKVVLMNKIGQGRLFTLKQNPNLSFELDWSFKLPRTGTVFENHPKCRIWIFWILAFSTNFCPIKTDLSGNTVWPQALGFQKIAKMDHFWHF